MKKTDAPSAPTTPALTSAEAREILALVKPLAAKYYKLTGKPLGVTGEVGELEAASLFELTLVSALRTCNSPQRGRWSHCAAPRMAEPQHERNLYRLGEILNVIALDTSTSDRIAKRNVVPNHRLRRSLSVRTEKPCRRATSDIVDALLIWERNRFIGSDIR